MYSNINYVYHVIHYILSTYLSDNQKFVAFDYLHPVPLPFPPCLTNLLSFSTSLFLKYNAPTAFCSFLGHIIVIWYLYTFQKHHHSSTSFHNSFFSAEEGTIYNCLDSSFWLWVFLCLDIAPGVLSWSARVSISATKILVLRTWVLSAFFFLLICLPS